MERIDQVQREIEVGEVFMVPCYYNVLTHFQVMYDDQYQFMDVHMEDVIGNVDWEKVIRIPVLNHPHSDWENGQKYVHSHVDFRFIEPDDAVDEDGLYVLRVNKEFTPKYFPMTVLRTQQLHITPVSMIQKSKMKHRCIKNGRCPHRGYDLSQESKTDGVITCPLHGMMFDAETLQEM